MERLQNADMKEFTSFKAGGKAKEMVILESTEELKAVSYTHLDVYKRQEAHNGPYAL